MPSSADLFVVCKHCGSEVSPYVTECPYCGQRLRRRAPKLPRENTPARAPRRLFGRRSSGSLSPETSRPRTRPSVRERSARWPRALAVGTRPNVTIAVVAASSVMWVLLRAGFVNPNKVVVAGPLHGDWWKLLSSQFAYINGLYAFITLLVIAIFGWLLERRIGSLYVLALLLGAGVAGALAALAVYPFPLVLGGNAAALALLAAWAAPDLRAARAGDYYEGDLLGAGALAALLLAIPFAVRFEANWLAGVTGGVLGLIVGLGTQRAGRAEL
jgi:membrane associated rhomboid family serine protease